jgi:hypothetical protein
MCDAVLPLEDSAALTRDAPRFKRSASFTSNQNSGRAIHRTPGKTRCNNGRAPLHHASSWNMTRISRDAYARVT